MWGGSSCPQGHQGRPPPTQDLSWAARNGPQLPAQPGSLDRSWSSSAEDLGLVATTQAPSLRKGVLPTLPTLLQRTGIPASPPDCRQSTLGSLLFGRWRGRASVFCFYSCGCGCAWADSRFVPGVCYVNTRRSFATASCACAALALVAAALGRDGIRDGEQQYLEEKQGECACV